MSDLTNKDQCLDWLAQYQYALTDWENTEAGYPAPGPPAKTKIDRSQFDKAESRAKTAPKELNVSFDDLVKYLTKDLTSSLLKVRAVTIWLSQQNFITSKGPAEEETPQGFLNLVPKRKEALEYLFTVLCRKVDVPCVVLSGFCKREPGYGYKRPSSPCVNSRWCAVYVDSHWSFIHLRLIFRGMYVKKSCAVKIETSDQELRERVECVVLEKIDEHFFLPSPDLFIYMCRPEQDVWQLLDSTPWTWTEYIEAPDRKPSRARSETPTLHIEKPPVPDRMEGYPPPAPPKRRKCDICNAEQFKTIDERAEQAPVNLYNSFEALFGFLFQSLDSDVSKARALLIWLSANYGRRCKLSREMWKKTTDPHTPAGAVKLTLHSSIPNRLSKEEFFAVLCRKAQIPCVLIRGQKKRADLYKMGDNCTKRKMVWNAAFLDGSWRLINTHDSIRQLHFNNWVTIGMDGISRTESIHVNVSWSIKFTEFFFLTDPDELVHFCFPDDEKWQLLDKPVSGQQFFEEPWLHVPYFRFPNILKPGCKVCIQANGGQGKIMIEGKADNKNCLLYNLYYIEEENKVFPDDLQLARYITITVVSKEPPLRSVFFNLPVVGIYILELINESQEVLCKFRVNCVGDIPQNKPFPGDSNLGFGFLETALDAGFQSVSREEGMMLAREGDKVQIRFRKKYTSPACHAAGTAMTSQKRFFGTLAQNKGEKADTMTTQVKVTEEEKEVVVDATVPFRGKDFAYALQLRSQEEKEVTGVANYLVTSDASMIAAAADRSPIDQNKAELTSATESDDVGRLEMALRESQYARVEEVHSSEQVNAQQRLLELHQNACEKAFVKGDAEALESAIMEIHQSAVSYYIHHTQWFQSAEKNLQLLKRNKKMPVQSVTLTQKHVDDMSRYNRPPEVVQSVLAAIFLLLGERTVPKEWKGIQKRLRSRGVKSILQRIKNCNSDHIDDKTLERVATLLNSLNPLAVSAASYGATAFYNWARSVLAQRRDETTQEASHPTHPDIGNAEDDNSPNENAQK